MHLKTLLAAIVLSTAPGLAVAQCFWGGAQEVTMSCAEGTTWDATAQTCVATATS